MVSFLGDIPREWEPKWNEIQLASGQDINLAESRDMSTFKLESLILKQPHDSRMRTLLCVVRDFTKFLPSERISAAQALDVVRELYERDDVSDED